MMSQHEPKSGKRPLLSGKRRSLEISRNSTSGQIVTDQRVTVRPAIGVRQTPPVFKLALSHARQTPPMVVKLIDSAKSYVLVKEVVDDLAGDDRTMLRADRAIVESDLALEQARASLARADAVLKRHGITSTD